jgi:predicted transposase YbfD/YdcC
VKKLDIKEKFANIEDPRHQSYVEHKLCDVLTIVMCAVMSGLDQLSDIVMYAENRVSLLSEKFGITAIPSKPTFSRILNMIDGEKVGVVILEIMRENVELLGDIIAVDGKAIRSTSEKGKAHSALQILTAYLTESGVTLAQKSIHEKTNEIPVFQEMLETLDVKEKTITADAMHCQKATCEKIIERGGNYCFGLKENQKTFFDDVKLFIENPPSPDSIEFFAAPTEKGHGRTEKRRCYKIQDISWLENRKEWAGLNTVFAVEHIVETKHKTTQEINYYISSLVETPEKLMKITREHWKIESLHWILDVVFSEDACRLESEESNKTLNSFRKLAILVHRTYVKSNKLKISGKQSIVKAMLDENHLVRVIGNFSGENL